MGESSTPSYNSNYLNLKFGIEKQLEAFKTVASFSPQLSPLLLIHNLEQVIEETERTKIENEDGHHDDPLSDFKLRGFKEEPAPPSENFRNVENSFAKTNLKSWEQTCLSVIENLTPSPQNPQNCQPKLMEDLDRIKNQLTTEHYETAMDFHADMILSLKTAHATSIDPTTTTSQASNIWSAYLGNQSMIQLLKDLKVKSVEALTVYRLGQKIPKIYGGEISMADGIENPFTETRLMQAEQYLAPRKDGTRLVYDCLICKLTMKENQVRARLHVLRVHFRDRFQCAGCSQKFYKNFELQRHKLTCQKRERQILDAKKTTIPSNIVTKTKQLVKQTVVRNASPNFDLTRAINVSVEVERFQGDRTVMADIGGKTGGEGQKLEKASQEKVVGLILKSGGKYKCRVCRVAAFSTMSRAARHVRTVHFREKNHFCTACHNGFYSLYSLRSHENSCRVIKLERQLIGTKMANSIQAIKMEETV